jgi:hypothetical protein|uniref:Secreted protein n=1 Tax=Zea mays TaxID=4577 RepID=B6STU9_MAIZE|nr:hypothetical protein [Zea mays]ACG39504.1 hypothetical protein [Zea mays]
MQFSMFAACLLAAQLQPGGWCLSESTKLSDVICKTYSVLVKLNLLTGFLSNCWAPEHCCAPYVRLSSCIC